MSECSCDNPVVLPSNGTMLKNPEWPEEGPWPIIGWERDTKGNYWPVVWDHEDGCARVMATRHADIFTMDWPEE